MVRLTRRELVKKWRDKSEAFWKLHDMYCDEVDPSTGGDAESMPRKQASEEKARLCEEFARDAEAL